MKGHRNPAFSACALGALLLAAGCRPAPQADSYPAQRLRDADWAFEALAEGDTERLLKSLDRLRGRYADDAFAERLAELERSRTTLTCVNQALLKGDPADARKCLDRDARGTLEDSPVSRAVPAVEALEAFAGYLRGRPYPDGARWAAAMGRLDAYATALADSPTFVAWQARERQALAACLRNEWTERVKAQMAVCEQSIIQERVETDVNVRDLARLAPDHPLVAIENGLTREPRRPVADLLAEAGRLPWGREAVELAFCRHAGELSAADARRVLAFLGEAPPATAAGLRVKALLGGPAGEAALALDNARQELARPPARNAAADAAFMGRVVEGAVLPSRQFLAGPWLTPFPSVSDALARLAQLRARPAAGTEKR